MSNIIAGRFDQQSMVREAMEQILRAGFPEDHISSFYVNPPGQHDLYAVGGDRDKSPGAENSERGIAVGAVAGGVVGAAMGLATIPMLGPVGPVAGALVGAHLGDLIGSLHGMQDDGDMARLRHAGMVLVVSTDDMEQEERAIDVLRTLHAQDIERAQGTIADGNWADFDPLMPPTLVTTH
ncbi:MAG: hypothetical protein JSS58_11020 [Proteobacteria bacterium]|nr:hypothetical protein [Pseudomonadota bacterium]